MSVGASLFLAPFDLFATAFLGIAPRNPRPAPSSQGEPLLRLAELFEHPIDCRPQERGLPFRQRQQQWPLSAHGIGRQADRASVPELRALK